MVSSLLVISGLILLVNDHQKSVRVERHLNLMGTTLMISVEAGDRTTALSASEKALNALQKAEKRLSTWTKDSELARLNNAAVGQPMDISLELAGELVRARHWWEETGGAFDPAIGALSAIWGLRDGGYKPSRETILQAVSLPGFEALHIKGQVATRLHPFINIDEGGFGKGAGLDEAIRILSGTGAIGAVINLGGQVAVFGAGEPYRFELAHPSDRRHPPVLGLTIDRGALATTGNSERSMQIEGTRYGHILDPRSGMLVPDFGSLTVWAKDALTADCLSTGLYVLGPDMALDWATRQSDIEILVLETTEKGLKARATQGFKNYIDTGESGIALLFQ